MEQIINKPYLNSKDVAKLANCNIRYARELMAEIRKEMADDNVPFFKSRQSIIPTQFILKKLKINSSFVRKQAKEMREVL